MFNHNFFFFFGVIIIFTIIRLEGAMVDHQI
jgi:hypothetical protein